MINIYFSKTDTNIFQIKTDEELHTYFTAPLNVHNFKKTDKNTWESNSDDDETIFSIYQIFNREGYTIIPNEKIKAIKEKFDQQQIDYQKYTELGIEIKKNKDPILPEIELKEGKSLKEFQKMPVNHMISIPNCANFSIPGSGKTIMTLSAFNILKKQNKVEQMWVIGPIASFKAWETDYEVLFDKSISKNTLRYHGANPSERKKLKNQIKDKDIIITSYGTAVNDLELIKELWRDKKIFLVLDESHHIKSIKATTKVNNETISNKIIQLGKYAKRKCILTGTPIPKDLTDLWSQITFLWPDIKPLKDRREFEHKLKEEAGFVEDEIKEDIEFMWSRVTNKQMSDQMPKKFETEITVKMDSTQQKIYSIIEAQMLQDMEEGSNQDRVRKLKKARVIRLLQIVTNPKLIIENDEEFDQPRLQIRKKDDKDILNLLSEYNDGKSTPKIIEVAKHARELSSGKGKNSLDIQNMPLSNSGIPKNVLIFTMFKGTARDIAKELEDQRPIIVTGSDKPLIRETKYDEFKNWDFSNGCGKILIATIGSIAESVSLHKNKQDKPVCQNVIYLEKNYNAGQYMQSLFRVYRIGSEKKLPVRYYFYKSTFDDGTGSVDDRVHRVLERRTRIMFDMLDDEFNLQSMSLGKDDDELDDDELDDVIDEIFQDENPDEGSDRLN
jgi:SNF2 family DNA or RNA helicase